MHISSAARTLNGNLLTTLPEGVFSALRNLLSVELADNRLICDCHLTWLGRWYRTKGQGHAVCSSPLRLKDRRLSDVRDAEFKCSGEWQWRFVSRGDSVESETVTLESWRSLSQSR